MTNDDRETQTAYHEIGHWLAADELNIEMDMISIIPNDDGTAGRIGIEEAGGYFFPPGTDPLSPENESNYNIWAKNQAIIDYAGHAAIVEILGIGDMGDTSAEDNGAGRDFGNAREILGGNDHKLSEAKIEAVRIIRARINDAHIIAKKLLQLKILDSQQIYLLIGGNWDNFFDDNGNPKLIYASEAST